MYGGVQTLQIENKPTALFFCQKLRFYWKTMLKPRRYDETSANQQETTLLCNREQGKYDAPGADHAKGEE